MASPVIVSTRITAPNNEPRSMPVFLPNSTTLAQAQAFMTAFATLLDNVTDGVVAKAEVTLPLTIPGSVKGSANAGASLNVGALIDYAVNGSAYTFGLWVPGWQPAGFVGNALVHSGAYAAFIDGMLNTIGASGAQPVDRYNNDLMTWTGGRKSTRK